MTRAFVGFLFQTTCLTCGGISGGHPICVNCESWEPATLARLPTGESAIDSLRSAYWLTEFSRSVLHAVKYGRSVSTLALVPLPSASELVRELGPIDAVVPVPLHWKRWLERGFNQADWLASKLARDTGTVVSHNLVKIYQTESQSTLTRKERAKNLSNAFCWLGSAPPSVLLVDDVFTTGATMEACARAAKLAGVKRVVGWSLFRTPLEKITGRSPT